MKARAGARLVVAVTLAALVPVDAGCAPIDVRSEVSVEPREAPTPRFGSEQLVARDYVADYVQLGPRVLIELRAHERCAAVSHAPVLRTEHIHRSNRGFVIWDFVLGVATGAFAALAFSQPQLFSNRLVDGQGREVYDNSGAYIVGGVFSAVSLGLLSAGTVDALRSRDSSHYADAYALELGPERPCPGADEGVAVVERGLRLRVADDIELEAETDERGRARFELPAWTGPIPAQGRIPAVLELSGAGADERALAFELRVPYPDMGEIHAGVADTRTGPALAAGEEPVREGPPRPEPPAAETSDEPRPEP